MTAELQILNNLQLTMEVKCYIHTQQTFEQT